MLILTPFGECFQMNVRDVSSVLYCLPYLYNFGIFPLWYSEGSFSVRESLKCFEVRTKFFV